ncbi:MAG: hypothetical protein ACJZ8E_00035 [Pseudohongiellaceae bacterium]
MGSFLEGESSYVPLTEVGGPKISNELRHIGRVVNGVCAGITPLCAAGYESEDSSPFSEYSFQKEGVLHLRQWSGLGEHGEHLTVDLIERNDYSQ